MGLLDRFLKRVVIPSFSVGVFGKLPCYKEYFNASCHPAFADLKHHLDQGFDRLIQSGQSRPYVLPDRRFFIRTDDPKIDLAGCIFESDDGMRGFPFMMAAPVPRKLHEKPFPIFYQSLERVWVYLEAFFQHLKSSESSSIVYNQVRNVSHQLDPFFPESWQPENHEQAQAIGVISGVEAISLEGPKQEETVLRALNPETNPAFILWPVDQWWDEVSGPVIAYLGSNGLQDMDIAFFVPNSEALDEGAESREPEVAELEGESEPDTESEPSEDVEQHRSVPGLDSSDETSPELGVASENPVEPESQDNLDDEKPDAEAPQPTIKPMAVPGLVVNAGDESGDEDSESPAPGEPEAENRNPLDDSPSGMKPE